MLERDERAVAGVRLGRPGRRIEARAPGGLPHLGIGEVVLDRRLLLGGGVARPHALRAPEVGNAGIGRDAGAGEDDDAARGVDAPARFVDRIARRHAVSCLRGSGRRATKSISTSAPLASAVTPMHVRAGRRPTAKWLAYAAFMAT